MLSEADIQASPRLPNIGAPARKRVHVEGAFHAVDEFEAVLDVIALTIRSLLFAFVSVHHRA